MTTHARDSDPFATPDRTSKVSIGLVHDYLLVMRGAERTFAEMIRCWPEAPIYTLLYDPVGTEESFTHRSVHSSYAQRAGSRQHNFKRLAPVFPHAIQQLPVSDHDLVISSSSAFAHGVRLAQDATHVCYCHSPFRYAWHEHSQTESSARWFVRPPLRLGLGQFRRWDLKVAARVDHYIANSQTTRERIERYYDRDADVVHPPVDIDRFSTGEPRDYFLTVGELVHHKRVEVALRAARSAGKKIKVVGDGPDAGRLKAIYGDRADFLGRVSDAELARLYSRALALVMPNIEEFGIAAVEAQAAGRPVLGVKAGGALETVVDGETGVLVAPEDVSALSEAMAYVDFTRFSPQTVRRHAMQFSSEAFRRKLTRTVARLTGSGASLTEEHQAFDAAPSEHAAAPGAAPASPAPVPV